MECCWKISKITKFCLSLKKFTTFMRIKKNSRGPPAKIDGELHITSWKMLEESVEIEKITKNHNWWESQNFAKTSTKINRDILMVYSRLRPFTKQQKKNYKKIKFWKPIKLWKPMEKCKCVCGGPNNNTNNTISCCKICVKKSQWRDKLICKPALILCTLFHCVTMDTVIIQIIEKVSKKYFIITELFLEHWLAYFWNDQ